MSFTCQVTVYLSEKTHSDELRQEDERPLYQALYLDYFNYISVAGQLLFCVEVLVHERNNIKMANNAKEKQIQQLEKEITTLRKKIDAQKEIINTYNGSYLQRTKVINGMKIAKKGDVTKETIQQLKDQGLTVEQIAEKLGCSRTTV